MADILPRRLERAPLTIIQEHGAIARGASLEEAFFYLGVMEYAGQAAFFVEMIKADLPGARARAQGLRPCLVARLPDYTIAGDGRVDFADEPETVDTFLSIGYRIFESQYSPFHTGAMSLRTASSLLYAPKAAMPSELPGPLLEVPLEENSSAHDPELGLHRALYRRAPFKALIHCYLAEAEVLTIAAGDKVVTSRPRVVPIDAEGGFLYPAVIILPPEPDADTLARALLDYRVVIVAWGGVWAAGEQALGEALRHVSSLKDICHYRILGQMRGLNLKQMEPERAQSW
jgi:ribulose-5-phosphate 4-epimerase/fuculose-1-phosphate aldolase